MPTSLISLSMYRGAAAVCLFLACAASGGVPEYAMRRQPVRQLRVTRFHWEKCTVTDNPLIDLQTLEVPTPLLVPGENNLRIVVDIKDTVDSPLYVEVHFARKVFGLGIPIPCIDNFGTCTYEDLCRVVNEFFASTGRCPGNIPYDVLECRCPLEKSNKPYDVFIPLNIYPEDISGPLAWLVQGTYEFKVEGHMNGREVGCWQAEMEIAQ